MGADQPVAEATPEKELLRLLKQAAADTGVKAWLVGGYVRDRILGRAHPDADVVVEEGGGDRMAARLAELAGVRPPVTFERFGTAQVTLPGHLVEFVSARSESYAESSRKPDVRPASLEEDLRRRDFTINTLLMDLDGNVHDRLGMGLTDLEARVIRTPAPPQVTFQDDPLRMLRAVRFAAVLGFTPVQEVMDAIRAMRNRLVAPVISAERVAEELRKMLTSPRPSRAIELLDEGDLLEVILPEVSACKGVKQGGYHTHDVYGHTLLALQDTEPDLLLRLAALFHDVGKPLTANPEGTFIGHEAVGAQIVEGVLERLRFATREIDIVKLLVRMHLRPVFYESEWTDGAVRRLARDSGEQLGRLMALARADLRASAYPDQAKLDELQRRLDGVREEMPSRLTTPIDGEDIMRVRGIEAGREVGRIKERLTELVLDGEVPPERESVLAYLREHPDL
jgi:poly(A) polymerase